MADPSLPLIVQELTAVKRTVLPASRDCQFVYVKKGRVFRRDAAGMGELSPGTPVFIPPGVGTSLVVSPQAEGVRIQKSCLLLKRSDMPILDVAYAVGYNNISFFNRYFRKIMKMSPREYRRYAQS